MPAPRLKPLPFALACVFSTTVSGEPIGLGKFEVDPALLTPPARREGAPPARPAPAPIPRREEPVAPRAEPAPEARPVPSAPPAGAAQPREQAPRPLAAPVSPAPALPIVPAPAEPPQLGTPLEMELEAIRAGGPLRLKPQVGFLPFPEGKDDPLPTFISAERLQGVPDEQVEAIGEAELRKRGQRVSADWMMYFPDSDEVYAEGRVKLEQRGDLVEGPALRLNFDTERGHMEKPTFRLVESGSHGSGERLLFEGEQKYRMQHASYTTCPAGEEDWYLNVGDLEVDKNRQVGTARNAAVWFRGVPVLYTPWMDFSLSRERKSGLLAPVFGSTAEGGAEVTLPVYWNIAPNRDATIAPRFMTKRGLMLNNEFRYLDPLYNGQINLDVLPDDRVTGTNRYALTLSHGQNLTRGFSGSIQIQKASDDAYFRDLSSSISVTSQTYLQRTGTLSYSGSWWGGSPWYASLMVQRWQTLQDPQAPLSPPYFRTPQLTLGTTKLGVRGADLNLYGTFVDFSHPTLPQGKRTVLYPSVSYPLRTAFGYVTPKLGVHYTRYSLDPATTTLQDASRSLPIFSVDSGVVFERELKYFGERFLQTLEPRIFYVYIPFRDQTRLPNFDTGEADFNFAQFFTENRFSGEDRVNDANQVTLAVTSRLLEPDTGNERLRIALGQRLNLTSQEVFLVAPTARRTRSDFLAAISGRVTPAWTLDAGLQYNPVDQVNEKLSVNARYQPESLKVANLGYRFTRNSLEQVDASAQWPLGRRWHGVARLNYSLPDSKVLEGLAGLEYNAGCWALRLVTQRFVTATQETATAFFVQLELNGLTNIGANPLELLRQSIPGYSKINVSEPAARPIFTEPSPGAPLY
ncbi:MAG: LPS assembly protein LptD [Betaproteobacteria bacterium]|nr:LPS assembly protein LptD [Betaproteobacteria bacterium]